MHIRQRGFTIVELLIVIVIIGILAALVIVAYNGIQGRARDADRQSDIRAIKNAIEQYKIDNGFYPAVCASDNTGCSASNLSAALSPTYLSSIPQDPQHPASGKVYHYVRGTALSESYGVYIQGNEVQAPCKTGTNLHLGWWGGGVPVC